MKSLDDLPRFGNGIGLHRVLELCRDVLDEPWLASLDAIKITGTNGKGSVAAMTSSILRAAGVSTGLYTSPHLFDVRERIVVDGEPVSGAAFAAAASWLAGELERYERLHPGDPPAFFEALTALALRHFASRRPETVVAEAGIGGRYDPVRLLPGRASALVSVDLEHAELLGSTLEEIACDKADVAAEGTTLVVGRLPAEVHRKLAAYARVRRLELAVASDVCRVARFEATADGERLDLEHAGETWPGVELALRGAHQAHNAAVAIVLAGRWLARHRGTAPDGLEGAVRQGLASVRCPCRLERVATAPDVYVDAAHTPAAIAALAQAARRLFAGRPIVLVVGVSRGRLLDDVVAPLLELAAAVVVTRAKERGAAVATVAEFVRGRGELPVAETESVAEALGMAVAEAARRETVVLVAGGLFLAAEAREACAGRK